MKIPVTQYHLPHGRTSRQEFDAPEDLARRAHAIIADGFRFEAEILSTGQVSLTVTHPQHGDWLITTAANGPPVVEAMHHLCRECDTERARQWLQEHGDAPPRMRTAP